MTLRSVGIALLGLVGGIIVGLVVQDAIAVALIAPSRGRDMPVLLGLAMGAIVPVLAVAGPLVALAVDRAIRSRGGD